jgi:hypothetical protein
MFWLTAGREGGYRLILSTDKAWLLHPIWKPDDYADWVPAIMDCVVANRVPDEQLGHPELQLKVWQQFLSTIAQDVDAARPRRVSE